jgi:hypothetical protein
LAGRGFDADLAGEIVRPAERARVGRRGGFSEQVVGVPEGLVVLALVGEGEGDATDVVGERDYVVGGFGEWSRRLVGVDLAAGDNACLAECVERPTSRWVTARPDLNAP